MLYGEDLHDNVYKVELPRKLLQTKRVDPLVKDSRESSEAEAKRKTLCSDIVGQDLNGVGDGQTRPCGTCDAVEQEDHGHDCDTGGGRLGLCVYGATGGPNGEGDQHAHTGEKEEDSASHAVDEEGGE